MTLAALLADDLTGALDGASPFAGAGFSTRLVLSEDASGADDDGVAPDVVAMSSDSRLADVDTATTRVRSRIAALAARRPALLVKKIDSLLRGHYASEVHEALAQSGRSFAIVCPALPSMRRTVAGGVLHVDGQAVADGTFLAGERSHALRRLGHFCGTDAVRFCDLQSLERVQLPRVSVVDAATDDDLDRLVDALWPLRSDVLWVGSSGLTAAIARRSSSGIGQRARIVIAFPLLLVIGSRSPVARRQLATMLEERLVGEVPSSDGAHAPGAVQRFCSEDGRLEVLCTPPAAGDGTALLAALAARAADIVGRAHHRTVAVIGGETLAAMLGRLEVASIEILGRADGAFEAGRLHGGAGAWADVLLLSRSGSFGTDGDLAALLRATPPGPGGLRGSVS